jgi:hypothetical protein
MTLLEEIERDLVDPAASLSTTLRKANILATRLQSEDLKNWVHSELNGYQEVEFVPEYRTINVQLVADYITRFEQGRNIPIPTSNVPNGMRESVETYTFLGGVRELESLLESGNTEFRAPLPAEFNAAMGDNLGMFVEMGRLFTRGQLELVLDTIKNRLLDLILEIESVDPNAGEKGKTKISSGEVDQAFNYAILGGYDVRITGEFSTQNGRDPNQC